MTENGLVTLPSGYPVAETIDRLAGLATARGLHIFARVDHADGAAKAGMTLRPTQLLSSAIPRAAHR